jgi:hypothetical protein
MNTALKTHRFSEEDAPQPHHPNTCGPCADCREALADYGSDVAPATGTAPTLPTPAQLLTHARRFGIEQVWETALQSGLSDDELVALLAELRGIAAKHRRKPKRNGAGHVVREWFEGLPATYRPNGNEGQSGKLTAAHLEVKALWEKGDSPATIVRKTKKPAKTVSRLLAEVREAKPLATAAVNQAD